MTDSRHTGFPDEEFVDDSAAFPDEEGEQGGLYEHFSVVADKGQTLLRLDKFLVARMEHCSRNRIQAAADSGNILVNGVPAKSSYKVKPLDRVQIVLPYPRRDNEIRPEAIPLEIPYEDDDLLLVNKQAGMVVHPGVGNWSGTLVNALAHHLRGTEIADSGEMRAGLVHRIDKDTSGLLVIAKNEQAHARLAKQFFDHSIYRRYVALVWGDFPDDEGTIVGNIGRSPRERQKMYVFEDGSDGKHAVTHWRVLKRYGYVTLVECRLETGRSSTTPATAATASSRAPRSPNTGSSSRIVSRSCRATRSMPSRSASCILRPAPRSVSKATCPTISARSWPSGTATKLKGENREVSRR